MDFFFTSVPKRTYQVLKTSHKDTTIDMGKASSSSMFKNLPSSRILKQITRLNNIAGTPETAFKFSPKYTKLELFLIKQNVSGSAIGLKKFWRNNLPTLKFHNEDVNFVLTRINTTTKEDIAKCPTKIVVYDNASNKHEIDCADKQVSDILAEVIKATEATQIPEKEIPVIATPQQDSFI